MPCLFIFMMLFELSSLSLALRIAVPSGLLVGTTASIYLLRSDNDPTSFFLHTFLNHEGRLDASNFSTTVTRFTKDIVLYTSFTDIGNYSVMAFLDSELQLDAGSSFSQSDLFDVGEPFSSEVQKRDLTPPAGDSEHGIFGSAHTSDLILIIAAALAALSVVSVVIISIYLCIDKRRRPVNDISHRDSRSSIWGTSESHADHPRFKTPEILASPVSSGSDSQPYTPEFQAIECPISHPPSPFNSDEISQSRRKPKNGATIQSQTESRPQGVYELAADATCSLRAFPYTSTESQPYTYSLGPEATEYSISSSYIPEEIPQSRHIPRNRAVLYPSTRNSVRGIHEFVKNLRDSLQEERSIMSCEYDLPEHVAKMQGHIEYLKSQLELARALGFRSPLPSPGSGGESVFPDISRSIPGNSFAPSRRSSVFY
ncbi:hypothetical protein IW261DRAFT_350927 [Armillaria novae-zelandiae]|uniref:Uncharacterized protein n=1 Tax=Armillaria novae-zelandiae TaxID=153914 RepID=A0AA39PQD6_9AGAR|nr:hypothetical protein IW261DRAFT_350927 [Armillaria novae-zelandiae]